MATVSTNKHLINSQLYILALQGCCEMINSFNIHTRNFKLLERNSSSIKCEELIYQPRNDYLLRKNSAP
jgi:hypothetical protein